MLLVKRSKQYQADQNKAAGNGSYDSIFHDTLIKCIALWAPQPPLSGC